MCTIFSGRSAVLATLKYTCLIAGLLQRAYVVRLQAQVQSFRDNHYDDVDFYLLTYLVS